MWFGTPDARIRFAVDSGSTLLLVRDYPMVILFPVAENHLQQAVATIITHSFTEHKNHKTLNPMVPMILLNETTLVILLL